MAHSACKGVAYDRRSRVGWTNLCGRSEKQAKLVVLPRNQIKAAPYERLLAFRNMRKIHHRGDGWA